MNQPVTFSEALTNFGDLGDVSTKYPVLAPVLTTLKITEFKKAVKVKDGAEQETLLVELTTLEDHPEFEKPDGVVKAGHKITNRILLTPSGEWTEDSTKKALARLMEAALGNHTGVFDPTALLGKNITVQIGVRPARDQYEASNEIKRLIPLTV